MANIEIVQEDAATGLLAEVYEKIIRERGALSEVLMIQSLNPESILRHLDLYITLMFGKSPLRRRQREMIAVVVSIANECTYCIAHHSEALNHHWKDADKLARFKSDFSSVGLDPADLALCQYASRLTLTPSASDANSVEELRAAGLNDRAILDTTLIVSYFNFVNRMVMGLGVNLEDQSGTGFNYD